MVKRKLSILIGVLSGLFVLSGCGELSTQSEYKDFANGFEIAAHEHTIECEINGECQQTYKCDKGTKQVMSGNVNGVPQYSTRTTWEECPHTTHETTYTVKTTAGDIVYAENLRSGEDFRDESVSPGPEQDPPEAWLAAKERLENGDSRPVTVLRDTQREPHKLQVSDELQASIDSLEKDWFLPYFPDETSFDGKVDKAHFVHYEPEHDFNEDLAYLNSALAVDNKHIDVHVVFVHANLDIEPELYTESLVTYWQQDRPGSTSLHPRNLVLVMGVDSDDTVAWVQTHTGHISEGQSISTELEERLTGTTLDESFVGRPAYDVETEAITHSDGILETVLWNSTQE